ncbi:hypothetical protein [Pseudomonas sp. BN102]|uniref:hypothetical protein n=1 Tax=Pseudomonas sp. BN102 TaxID=2567886 RepID=UPI0024545C7B|nr:hypothetical protein [Pseudomonas sp. BN102]MDH4610308.1 hypothetical protein [Pseudomonas sp. BN102]
MLVDALTTGAVTSHLQNYGVVSPGSYTSSAECPIDFDALNRFDDSIFRDLGEQAERKTLVVSGTGVHLYRGKPKLILVINDVAKVDGVEVVSSEARSSYDSEVEQATKLSTKERLGNVQSCLDLSITQMSELFGVTRKAVYDWMDGAEPRSAALSRIVLLEDIIASTKGVDLKRLKTVWNLPVSGRSFKQVLADDALDKGDLLKEALAKISELAPRMGMAKIKGSDVFLGDAHLTDIDRTTDVG